MNTIAYGLRYPPSGQAKHSTRIKWGHSDLILYKKPPGTRYWTVVDICVPLPTVDMCAVVTPHISPAPGRQGRETLKRQRPVGSGSERDNCVVDDRRVKPRPSVSDSAVDHATEAQARQDPGRVIAEESYCPASPAPVKKHPGLSGDQLESPIFKKATPSSFRINPIVI